MVVVKHRNQVLTLDQFMAKQQAETMQPIEKAVKQLRTETLYKMQSFVTSGGKPRRSHPWFTVAGGLLGSTSASIRTRVKLSERLTYGDRRDLEERLEKLGFEEKWNPRMGGAWSGAFFETVDFEANAKAITKEEKQRVKENWLSYHKSRFDPFVKIALEYGAY